MKLHTKFAYALLATEAILFLYWVVVLFYFAIVEKATLLSVLVFGFHYGGTLGLIDVIKEHLHRVHLRQYHPGGGSGEEGSVPLKKTGTAPGSTLLEEEDEDEDDIYDPNTFPLLWTVSLMVAGVTDAFSIPDIKGLQQDGIVGDTGYKLAMILFSVGFILTVATFVWTIFFFIAYRARLKKSSQQQQQQRASSSLKMDQKIKTMAKIDFSTNAKYHQIRRDKKPTGVKSK